MFFVGGGTAVLAGWRASTIDADLYSDKEAIFRDVQAIKERLQLNIEFARPEDFVPALAGTASRHVFIETVGKVSFYHYDPYAQLLSKVVRGFNRDMLDASNFITSGMVDPKRFLSLVKGISESAYAKYPTLSRRAVLEAVNAFLRQRGVCATGAKRTPSAGQRTFELYWLGPTRKSSSTSRTRQISRRRATDARSRDCGTSTSASG